MPAHPDTDAAGDALVGRVLGGRYLVVAGLAVGGMSRVYRARDNRLDRDVAVKVLAERYAVSAEFSRRFLDEGRAAASVSHPNLVHVYDSGTDGSARYIVMELLEGYRSLREVLDAEAPLGATQSVAIARQLLAGLQAAHARGLVHCDVKAGNVMVGPGPLKLIDFGIARVRDAATNEERSIGSLHAMAPEQLSGGRLTAATDVFAVGVVLHQCLTGRVPYAGATPGAVASAQQDGPPPATGLPVTFATLLRRALDPDPARRYQTAHEMRVALDAAAATPPVSRHDTTRQVAVPPAPTPRRRAPRAGSTLGVILVSLAAVAIAAGLLIWNGALLPGSADVSSPSTAPTPTLAAGQVRVPNTIGLSEKEAEAAARDAGLRWTIRWQKSGDHPAGIYDQEPPAGEIVERGSRFTMYSYRNKD